MQLPTILTGAAGRALNTLAPLEALTATVDDAMKRLPAVTDGLEVRVGIQADPSWLSRAAGTDLINSAGDDIISAIGRSEKARLSSELHAATQNVQSGVEFFRPGQAGSSTVQGITDATKHVRAGLDELRAVADKTARTRVVIGTSIALGGGIAGAIALSDRGSEGRPMAPGMPGAPRPEPVRA